MVELQRTRILLITRNLPPLVGGMERLNWHMADELAKAAEVRIIGPQGSAVMAPATVAMQEVPLKPLWNFLLRAAWKARQVAKRWRPHVVLAGSGLTAPLAWLAARACGARAVAYVHGLDVAVKHPLYRALWLPAIRRMDVVIANSRPTATLCRQIGVAAEHIAIVHPGVELPADEYPNGLRSEPLSTGRGAGVRVRPTTFASIMASAIARSCCQSAAYPPARVCVSSSPRHCRASWQRILM